MKQIVFRGLQNLLFWFSSLLSRFVKKDNSLVVLCVAKILTENHKVILDYYLKNKPDLELVILSRGFVNLDSYSQIKVVRTFSLSGLAYFLKTKKILISHGDFDHKPHKKQPYHTIVNFWHGIPIKNIGVGLKQSIEYMDFMLVSSDIEKEVMKRSYGLREEQILVMGVPKNDALFEHRPVTESEKSLVYLPTYRDSAPTRFFEFSDQDLVRLDSYFKSNNIVVKIKPHPNDLNNPNLDGLAKLNSVQIVSGKFDIQTELKKSLGLITDYSGVLYDALAIDLPMLFLPYDFEEYNRTVGFHRDYKSFIPGPIISSQVDFIAAINSILDKSFSKDHYPKIRDEYYHFQDSNATSRLFDFLAVN